VAPKGTKLVASNRRARFDYEVLETIEAGIALAGTEVKAFRASQVQLKDAYARPIDGELWLIGMHVAPYELADGFAHQDPERRRKLLLHRSEIDKLVSRMQEEVLSLVPLSVYFSDGRVKVELGLARGRKRHDKRSAIAERDARRETDRAMSQRRRDNLGGRG
jgi:SsrA-binding protein